MPLISGVHCTLQHDDEVFFNCTTMVSQILWSWSRAAISESTIYIFAWFQPRLPWYCNCVTSSVSLLFGRIRRTWLMLMDLLLEHVRRKCLGLSTHPWYIQKEESWIMKVSASQLFVCMNEFLWLYYSSVKQPRVNDLIAVDISNGTWTSLLHTA